LFVREEYKQITIDSLKYCQENKDLNVHAYCIMTSHIHLILSVNDGGALSDVIRDLKSFTSTKLKNSIRGNDKESRKECLFVDRQGCFGFLKGQERRTKRTPVFAKGIPLGQLWQQHNHPIELSTSEMMAQRLDYLPRRQGGYS